MPRSAKHANPLQRVPKGQPHPYKTYEDTPLWRAIDKAIGDLVRNQDLAEDEYHDYIVGYICKVVNRRCDAIVKQLKNPS